MKVKQTLDFSKSAIDPNMSTFDWKWGRIHAWMDLKDLWWLQLVYGHYNMYIRRDFQIMWTDEAVSNVFTMWMMTIDMPRMQLVFPRLSSICHDSIWISATYIQLSLFNGQLGLSHISKVTGVKSPNWLTKGDLSQLKPTEATHQYRNGDYRNEAKWQYYTTRTNTFTRTYTTMSTGIGVHGTNKSKSM